VEVEDCIDACGVSIMHNHINFTYMILPSFNICGRCDVINIVHS
jgi:hypothetical protein